MKKAPTYFSLENGDDPVLLNELNKLYMRKLKSKKTAPPDIYRSAFVEINITPKVSEKNAIPLQGMSGSPRLATGISLPLFIQLLLLEDKNKTRVLLVSADLFGISEEMAAHLKRVCLRWGIDSAGILFNASHTHYAPGTVSHINETLGPLYPDYAENIILVIEQQLPILCKNLKNCQLFHGAAEARIGVNRRLPKNTEIHFAPNEDGFYDTFTPFMLVRYIGSKKKIILFGHGCHPTGIGQMNLISSDFPGYTRKVLLAQEDICGAMFFQGALGSVKESRPYQDTAVFCSHPKDAGKNGKILADAILAGLYQNLLPVNGNIFCINRKLEIPLKRTPSSRTLNLLKNNPKASPLFQTWAAYVLNSRPSDTCPSSLSMSVQCLSIGGGISFLAFPAELVSELAPKIRSVPGGTDNMFLLSCTNGLCAYLPTDEMIEKGGYEAEMTYMVYLSTASFDCGTESVILKTVEDCYRERSFKEKPNGYGRFHFASNEKRAFFVLSSGRCGTMTLAGLLDTASNARVWHHPQPDLINECLEAYHGKIDKRKVFWDARHSILHKTWSEGFIHGETDHLMTPFCDFLADEISGSKFILLVRDPREFVRSGMRRNYYKNHTWDFGRLRPEEGTKEFLHWNELEQFEKVCWLWRETYEKIIRITKKIPEDRITIVKFEDLVKDTTKIEEIFRFLGLEGFEQKKAEALLKKKLNNQKTGAFPNPSDWPEALEKMLWKECGAIAEYFGYHYGFANKEGSLIDFAENNKNKTACHNILFLEAPDTTTGGHLDHIVRELKKTNEVKYLKSQDPSEISEAVSWADVVWLEWANQMAIYVTNHVPQIQEKKVICRLHGYEVFSNFPAEINWRVVNRLIFVAEHKQALFAKKFNIPALPRLTIRNGIDLDNFTISDNKHNTKKLVLLGHLNWRKGLPSLLQFYKQLLKRDPSYYLYVRGEFQDARLELAVNTMIQELELSNKIEFVGWTWV